jgi:hypothetical protein
VSDKHIDVREIINKMANIKRLQKVNKIQTNINNVSKGETQIKEK